MPRRRRFSVACLAVAPVLTVLTHGCGIDLTESLSGRPCKNGECLDGWVCRDDICVPEGEGPAAGSGGASGAPLIDASAGSAGREDAMPAAGAGGVAPADASPGGSPALVPDGSPDGRAPADAADAAIVSTRVGRVPCKEFICDVDTTSCCLADFPGYPTLPNPAGFSCRVDTSGCEWVLHCDGDHDCGAGQVCCAAPQPFGGMGAAQCATSCASGDAHIECTKSQDCGAGLVCCGHMERNLFQTPVRYDRITCQSSCSGADDRIMCDDSSACGSISFPDCRESALFPGLLVCQ
jgi:hypothetical protein